MLTEFIEETVTIPHLLLLEDDDDQRRSMTILLERSGFRVTAASSVEGGRARVRGERDFDAVVADYHLGDGTLRDLWEEEELDARRTIVVTGHSGISLPPGMRLLRKPIEPSRLMWALAAVLGRSGGPSR